MNLVNLKNTLVKYALIALLKPFYTPQQLGRNVHVLNAHNAFLGVAVTERLMLPYHVIKRDLNVDKYD